MTLTKLLLGMAVGGSLMLGLEPLAQALPIAPSQNTVGVASDDGLIVKVLTRAGVAHRSARRTTRRVVRRHTY